MYAVVVTAPDRLAVTQMPDPTPAPDGVVIAVRSCGICGTDLHLVSGDLGVDRLPLIPGHEPYGEVVAVGAGLVYR
ncbi:alcohol dehydrogenase catalytic domain-containing protein [Streptosporangium sp. NBC_01755]|uniref:alcohol dehydrogenase catalytic domain-containing protein n=1 Tax=unclassified Streptosporangium TaxID=2632669 RepID=UPI002DD84FB7|nr:MULTISPECIES: alcohol dehydrogenase catalytic domain-containing protein [unclassified Streptosporangium]WSA24160.1 alcohol dehydrogenase catalytic domain-containing protein [Streptosporangium sp. NBC_01810]WSC97766.1 alcohol dehydrogenase catalytic domain-containing protein [Streptosporangium sp. NBC_01755]